jgi:hypothetical protein
MLNALGYASSRLTSWSWSFTTSATSKRVLVPTGVFIQDLRKPSIRLLSDPETS